ncbi:hypothetical protein MFIFM68171_07195 [Madurella fahalii]|uniref:Uncharacterized protein n=1 Tax=Madurella fahalii TaxID=1157608 RepID=A0ABQ0GGU5_9PEZI
MRYLQLLTVVALAARSILASPTPQPLQTSIHRRALNGTGIYLAVDCRPREAPETPDSPQSWLSLVIYCESQAECNSTGHYPAARDICVKRTSNMSSDYHKWENSDWQHCYFEERGVFSWVLSRFARLFPAGTEVGEIDGHSIGEDADSQDFAGFRDDEFQGAGPATHNCSKVYHFT